MAMTQGMLWFENSTTKNTKQIIDEAVKYYENKYNKIANCCMVNPKTIAEEFQHENIKVKFSKSILLNHYWVGQE